MCLQELTLSPYFAITPEGPAAAGRQPEELESGRTFDVRGAGWPRRRGVYVHASLYERAEGPDGLGYNTAIVVAPDGGLVSRTRKLHIPVTAGYYEDHYFRPGPADGDPFPLIELRRRRATRGWAARPAGTSGSPSSRAHTRWPAPRY